MATRTEIVDAYVNAWSAPDLDAEARRRLSAEMRAKAGLTAHEVEAVAERLLGRKVRGKAKAIDALEAWADTLARMRAGGDRVSATIRRAGASSSEP